MRTLGRWTIIGGVFAVNRSSVLGRGTKIFRRKTSRRKTTNTEPHLLRATLPSDPVPTPSDSLLESLTTPTPNQMIPQSQTIEPTPDETASESPNQESAATETHDIAYHPIPTIESSLQEPAHQMVSVDNELTQIESSRPPNWDTFTRNQKAHWRKRILKINKNTKKMQCYLPILNPIYHGPPYLMTMYPHRSNLY